MKLMTPMRQHVLSDIWDGRCTKEIAQHLRISPKTAEYHRAKLFIAFGVNNLVSLVRRGLEMGYIESTPRQPSAKCVQRAD
jgi:DNA-binding NarL/FixJ family response regulator